LGGCGEGEGQHSNGGYSPLPRATKKQQNKPNEQKNARRAEAKLKIDHK